MLRGIAVVVVSGAIVISQTTENAIRRLDGSTRPVAEIDAAVERLMRAGDVPGLALAMFNDRKPVYVKAYGYRDVVNRLPFTVDSVVNSASFTKSTFAYVVMQLVEEGTIDLDQPVHEYLKQPLPSYPQYKDLASDDRYRKLTARILLSHRSGFPNLRAANKGVLNINFDPGSRYAYSGEGIQLLQFVIEQMTGRSITEIMHDRVFAPLGMGRTSMIWQPAFETDHAHGHDGYGRSLGPQRRPRPSAGGSMQTTIADYSRFIETVLQGKRLKPESRALMFSPAVSIRSPRQFPTLSAETTDRYESINLSYGLGWGLFFTPVGKAIFKEGHDEGWQHYMVLFDAAGTAMITMTNSNNGEGIFQALQDQLLKNAYTPFDWEGFVPYERRPPLPPLPDRRATVLDAAVLDSYVGRYRASDAQPTWRVSRAGDRLTLLQEPDGAPLVVTPRTETIFFARDTNTEIWFERDAKSRVLALRMLPWPYRHVRVE